MNDKELLELAAKAAGIELYCCNSEGVFAVVTGSPVSVPWNPLADDGDALRLAVKLGLFSYEIIDERLTGAIWADDPYAATRRAIVRAAAEIGKDTP